MSTEIRQKMLDKKYQARSWNEILLAPTSVIKGVSPDDEKLLETAFNIRTIKDLAENKFFVIAQTIYTLAELEKMEL